jgi:hypothetical protein
VSVAASYRPINNIGYPVTVDFQWGVNIGDTVRSAALEVMNALSTRDEAVRTISAICPTGRCTWANYSSLGVCHKCQDVSSLLVPVCSKQPLAFQNSGDSAANPCGYRLNGTFSTGIFGTFGYDKSVLGLSTL